MKQIREACCSECGRRPIVNLRRILCSSCMYRLSLNGPLPPIPGVYELMVSWRHVDGQGCWVWLGSIGAHGYGRWGMQYVHRISYEQARGAIPPGLSIDHLCRNRACFNPEHLEPVTPKENALRGKSPRILLHHSDRCSRGHLMDAANTYIHPKTGHRACRKCNAARMRERYRRERATKDAAAAIQSSLPGEPACTAGGDVESFKELEKATSKHHDAGHATLSRAVPGGST